MAHVTRRFFSLSSAALSVGCAIRRTAAETVQPAQNVREPVVGQSWRYAKHDIFTGAVLDYQVDRIAAVDHAVDIDCGSALRRKRLLVGAPGVVIAMGAG
jgi:hypothetical protein